MYPGFGRICVLVILFQYTYEENITSESYGEKMEVHLTCDPPIKGSMILWFRVRENDIEFLASYTSSGEKKFNSDPNMFSNVKGKSNTLTLKEFQRARDSGIYSCASYNSNKLNFGKGTRLQGLTPVLKPTIKTIVTTYKLPRPNVTTSNPSHCSCKMKQPTLNCDLKIFAPLAGGCGLLFIILILTICYCNRVRTNRCPHHYKRKPKNHVPVHHAMPCRTDMSK